MQLFISEDINILYPVFKLEKRKINDDDDDDDDDIKDIENDELT